MMLNMMLNTPFFGLFNIMLDIMLNIYWNLLKFTEIYMMLNMMLNIPFVVH